jgi:hypothetical protein
MPEYIPTRAAAMVINKVNKIARSPSFSSISSIMTPNKGANVTLVRVIKERPITTLVDARNTIPKRLKNQTHMHFDIRED